MKNYLWMIWILWFPLITTAQSSFTIQPRGTYQSYVFDEGAAEITAYNPSKKHLYVTNSNDNSIDVLSYQNPSEPTRVYTLDLDQYGGGVNSVDVFGNTIAIAVQSADSVTALGSVLFFTDNSVNDDIVIDFTQSVTVGALPDMLTFSKDGSIVVVANEGEPNDDYSYDPEGSVSIITVSDFSVQTATFSSFNDVELDSSVRIFGPNATVAQDLEPEYIALNTDATIAYVALQENNAIAIVDINSATVTNIIGLGFKDHSLSSNSMDASNRDDQINIQTWPVKGMYQPDAMEYFEVNGQGYLITANEGDSRDYDGFSEEARVKDVTLDETIFPDAATLQQDENLGRLNITTTLGDSDNDGVYEELYSYGARSFSIWNASDGSLVWDSGNELEVRLAELNPLFFNANNDDNDSFDSRSDDKGPEPEAVSVATVNGKLTAFVGLERIGGVMVYDLSDLNNPMFVDYFNNRDFNILWDEDNTDEVTMALVGDAGPENIRFVTGDDSPTGGPMIFVANEVTGSVTNYDIITPIVQTRSMDNDAVVTVEGIVIRQLGRKMRIQDRTGATSTFASSGIVFDAIADGSIREGDYIRLTGQTAEFNGVQQLDNFTSFEVLSRNNALPSPQEVTISMLNSNGEEYESELVILRDVSLVNMTDETFQAGTNYTLTDGVDQIVFRIDSESDTEWENQPPPTGSFDFVGVSGEFRGTRQLYPVFLSDVISNFSLTLLHNNDGESQLIDAGSGLEDFGGVARFKSLVDKLKQNATASGKEVVMLSSGDNFLAGPEFNASLSAKAQDQSALFYDAIAIDAIGYDALAMGNHDFDFGPEIYAELISDVENSLPPFISSNLNFDNQSDLKALENEGRIAKSVILTKGGEQIGVIGATTENLPFISSPGLVQVNEVKSAIESEVTKLTNSGVNKIILISHLQGVQEDSLLATQLTDIDIVIAGGGDELLANEDDLLLPGQSPARPYPMVVRDANNVEVPIVTTAGNYTYVGQLEVEFDENGNLMNYSGGPQRVADALFYDDGVQADPELVESVVQPVLSYLEELETTIIGTSTVSLDGERSNIRGKETNLGNLVTDAYRAIALERSSSFGLSLDENRLVGIANGGGIRASEEAGDISILTTFNILPFSNFLAVVQNISPDLFKEIMENAISRIGEDGLPSGGGTGRFAQISGFSIEFDPHRAAIAYGDGDNQPIEVDGARIKTIRLDDGTYIVKNYHLMEDAPNVDIVTADFTAKGGDQYPFRGSPFTTLGITYQQTLESFIKNQLKGQVSANDYPEGGVGRIRNVFTGGTKLTLLHNNDGESQLLNAGSGLENFGGVARFKSLADTLKKQASEKGYQVMMVSSGDNFLAGPEFSASLDAKANDVSARFYDAIAIDAIGYDALAMGNHDFDFGPVLYSEFIADVSTTEPVFLSANLGFENVAELKALESEGRVAKSVIIEKGEEQFGVIGATTENLSFISSPGAVTIQSVKDAIEAEITKLESEGIDKIILISHLQSVSEDTTLATLLSGVDIMVAGGGDDILANPNDVLIPGDEANGAYPLVKSDADGNDILIVTGDGNYKYIGNLNVTFDENGIISAWSGGPKRVASDQEPDGVPENQSLVDLVVTPVSNFVGSLDETIIGVSDVNLVGERNNIRSKETNLGNIITDGYLWAADEYASNFGLTLDMTKVVAIANGGGIRTAVEAGNISVLDTYDILPFSNVLAVTDEVSPVLFKEIMENAVSRIDGTSFDAVGDGTGRFAQIAGFVVEFDPTQTAIVYGSGDNQPIETPGNRIISITLHDGTQIVSNGQVLDAAPNVRIVSADFTLNGGDQYPFRGLPYTRIGLTYQQSLEQFIRNGLNGSISSEDYPVDMNERVLNTQLVSNDLSVLLPEEFQLKQNYPNPFNPTTNIEFSLPEAADVSLVVYDMLGREVAQLVNSKKTAGVHTVNFNATNLASGVYIYRIQAGSNSSTMKMLLIK